MNDDTEALLDRLAAEMETGRTEVVRRALRELARVRESARMDAERAMLDAGRLRAALRGAGLDGGAAEVEVSPRGRVIAHLGEFTYHRDRETGQLLRGRMGAEHGDVAVLGEDGSIEFAESFPVPAGGKRDAAGQAE